MAFESVMNECYSLVSIPFAWANIFINTEVHPAVINSFIHEISTDLLDTNIDKVFGPWYVIENIEFFEEVRETTCFTGVEGHGVANIVVGPGDVVEVMRSNDIPNESGRNTSAQMPVSVNFWYLHP